VVISGVGERGLAQISEGDVSIFPFNIETDNINKQYVIIFCSFKCFYIAIFFNNDDHKAETVT